MKEQQAKVQDFMMKHNGLIDAEEATGTIDSVDFIAREMRSWSRFWLEKALVLAKKKDPRLLRATLMVEELAELLDAMSNQSFLKVADGIADLLYVVLGTSECYNMEAEDLFEEVHRSNMTKQVSTDIRVRDKGPHYVAPDLAGILKKWGFSV